MSHICSQICIIKDLEQLSRAKRGNPELLALRYKPLGKGEPDSWKNKKNPEIQSMPTKPIPSPIPWNKKSIMLRVKFTTPHPTQNAAGIVKQNTIRKDKKA